MKRNPNGQLTKNFHIDEFRCRCGCGRAEVQQKFVEKLQRLRNLCRRPIIIVSGYRCSDYNRKIGGHPNSYHCQGLAADIYSPDILPPQLYEYIERMNFEGVGYNKFRFYIHVDIGPDRYARWHHHEDIGVHVWIAYVKKGK